MLESQLEAIPIGTLEEPLGLQVLMIARTNCVNHVFEARFPAAVITRHKAAINVFIAGARSIKGPLPMLDRIRHNMPRRRLDVAFGQQVLAELFGTGL